MNNLFKNKKRRTVTEEERKNRKIITTKIFNFQPTKPSGKLMNNITLSKSAFQIKRRKMGARLPNTTDFKGH